MYKLPDRLREELRTPIGQLVADDAKLIRLLRTKEFVVAVGDVVTLTLIKHGVVPAICVVDFKTRRGECDDESKKLLTSVGDVVFHVANPPGCISDELWQTMQQAYTKMTETSVRIEVDGEDDLASLAAIFLAPRGTTVIYGLPDKGVLLVDTTDEYKEKVRIVLEKMKEL